MINEYLSIIDRLIKLINYRDERLDKRFKDIYKPVFDELLLVHRDYVEIFTNVLELLPLGSDDKSTTREKAIAAAEYLRKRRIEFEPLRVKLRALANELQTVDLDKIDNTFISEVRNYLSPIASSDTPYGILNNINTATMDMLNSIEDMIDNHNNIVQTDDMKYVAKNVQKGARDKADDIRLNWVNVCEAYAVLQVSSNPHVK